MTDRRICSGRFALAEERVRASSRRGRLRAARSLLAVLVVAVAACQSASPTPSPTPIASVAEPAPSVSEVETTESPSPSPVVVTPGTWPLPTESLPAFHATLVTEAAYPAGYAAGLAAAPDGRIFYSELFNGRVRVIRPDGSVDPEPWADVSGEFGIAWTDFYHGGLSGIAFDPAFDENGFVYVVTQVPDANGIPARSLVVRYRERGGHGTDPTVILEVPASKYDNIYSVVFGPDGMLYVPSGQSRGRGPGVDPLSDLYGKILRVRPDGTAPPDNPFGAATPQVWAQGLRNAFDVAFLPGTPFMVAGENGAESHDEINLLMAGHDYGWPTYAGVANAAGVTEPLLDYGDTRVAPAGIAYYEGDLFPALKGRFLVCHNHGPGLFALRLDPADPGRIATMTQIAEECSLDVITTPAGGVLFSNARAIYSLEPS